MPFSNYLHVSLDSIFNKKVFQIALSIAFIFFLAGVCTMATLYCNFKCSIVYFVLYVMIIVYVFENWSFHHEIKEYMLKQSQVKLKETSNDEKVKFLLTIIKTLTVEMQQLKDIISIIPKNERMRRVKSMGSIDWDSS